MILVRRDRRSLWLIPRTRGSFPILLPKGLFILLRSEGEKEGKNAGEPAFCKKPDSPAPSPAKTPKYDFFGPVRVTGLSLSHGDSAAI